MLVFMSEDYTIKELSKKTKIPVRTIHSYIEKGLLKAPPHKGPKTSYQEEHRSVLEAIRLLKDHGIMGISAIRDYLDSMTPKEIELIYSKTSSLDEMENSSERPPKDRGKGMSTIDYIKDVRERAKYSNPAPRRRSWGPELSQVLDEGLVDKAIPVGESTKRSTWTEFEVFEDVKILVRGNLDVDEKRNFGRIARFVKKLLRKSE